jgi:ubiquinone/menaquinone biosynthesis C-methylase UbiE
MADQGNTTYYGLMTSTWDLIRPGQEDWPDRFFFQEVIGRYGEPALDVGCATGRLILTYLKAGLDVEGVDGSPEMLALCRAKAEDQGLKPTLHQQPMEQLDLPKSYRTIIVSSATIQLLTDPDATSRAMDRLHRHLEVGGALIMTFETLWSEGDPTVSDWKLTGEAIRESDGAVVRRWTWFRYDHETQLEHCEFRYEVSLDGETLAEEHQRFSPESRSYTQQQAVDLYTAAGFEDVRVWKATSTDPAAENDMSFAVIGVRSQPS